jgi:hypothetical protein
MKKNILKKINPPSFDSFLRNLGRFFIIRKPNFFEKHKKCVIFVVDYDFKKIISKKLFFTTFTFWLTIFFTCKNARIARKNFF